MASANPRLKLFLTCVAVAFSCPLGNARPSACPAPTIPSTVTLCSGPVILDANSGNLPGLTYQWSDGQTSKTITVSQQEIISVVNTDLGGCTSQATTVVVDNRPQVHLGPDQSFCQNTSAGSINGQNPGANFLWTVNGSSASNGQSRAIDTSVVGIFVYKLVVTDPVTACTNSDEATIRISSYPTVAVTPSLGICVGSPTPLVASGALSYTWSPSTGLSATTGKNVIASPVATTTYTVVGSGAGGCKDSESVTITVNNIPAKPIITGTGLTASVVTLTSNISTGNQWFKNGALLPGVTTSVISVTSDGAYSTQVTQNGCVGPMSDPFAIVITGLHETSSNNSLIYPNPASEFLSIDRKGFDTGEIEINIRDVTGRSVFAAVLTREETRVDISSVARGYYLLKATQRNTSRLTRLVKN